MYDFHTHFIPENVIAWLKENKQIVNAKWINKEVGKDDFLIVNEKWGFELKKSFIDQNLYIQQQKEANINHSLISPIPQLFMYDFPVEITSEISEVYNQSLADWVTSSPTNLSALGTVPLNDPKKASQMLQECMSLGLKGAIIGPGLTEHMLSDDFFIPFFEEANRLKAILFIHPLLCEDPRLKRRMLPNLIGVPWETTVCAADILLSGLIDKYPNLKILFAHGGGFLPYQIGRLDKGFNQWEQVSTNLKVPPSEYLKRFWYDNVLWNEESIEFLVKTVGEDRVVTGTDFPFDLSVWPPKQMSNKGAESLLNTI
ncbi:amidohydrolase family protein [Lysinibacillus sp. BW-2-10]|uniref:amidohydrolase family protein n=1 Tax=Lysinibacillus sp. BW-2-10 TaxID=2590030 RepID=UPI00117DBE91|nr:amidohydrolase family protein [Lysinibacillus sp. BW-2-10]TSI08706.1 amidohydrolase [Lysinibacillus sp. BW-2-10]